MNKDTPATRTLDRAVILAGGERELAKQLDVPLADLTNWLTGAKPPPPDIYLKALDIVSKDGIRRS